MQHSEFVHLHVHSEYSLLDGAARLEKLVAKAKALRFPAIALTDHGNLFGSVDFYTSCEKAGVKPILGCELYVAPGSRFERSGQDGSYEGASHCTVLVRNRAGHANLMKLVSKAYLEGFYYKPRVDRELLAQHADGLLVLSGCLNSEVSRLLIQGRWGRRQRSRVGTRTSSAATTTSWKSSPTASSRRRRSPPTPWRSPRRSARRSSAPTTRTISRPATGAPTRR